MKMGIKMAAHSMLHLLLVAGLLSGATAVPLSQQAKRSQKHKDEDCANSSVEAFHEEWGITQLASGVVKLSNGTELQLFPASDTLHKHIMNSTRRILGDFRQCSPCTCCDRSRRWCLPTVCCYNIRCGVRGLPFGLCSFVPISCTCFGCRS
ncbi:uncharacterized protein [Physcomitrium patens]|uniref:DUF7866 domain-containing protein n=1 Tax=Physcomitrium patens TaxID=3218 RepID=A0A7I4E9U9_PHYPA|nr:uncharacterized protein LOC112284402 isoform X2 [Physcomitrium patens]XP_024379933.1 uncharacterized protein LOC112284402 isoform X2 [Physcomitrium patens]|eukprot:XP_024379932.1 uncharacterized protein LOC112284402 isoform X2 [Physcomitrella patens]